MKFKCANIAVLILFIAFFSFQITGCGSNDDGEPDGEDSGGDSGLTVAVSVSADPTSIVANGTSTSTITAIAKTDEGEGVGDIEVRFVADNGSITASGITDVSGKATATLTSSTQQGVANVTASVGSISGATTVTFSDSGASTISVSADPTSIVADGTSTSAITATVKTATGQGVPNIKVEFGADNGSITASGITDGEGKASATLTSSTEPDAIANVTASVGTISGTTTVTFSGSTTVVLGKISLATSQVSVKSDNLDFATITATVLDTNNAIVEGVTVSFSTNEGQISYASVDTDENGKAEITFSSGTDKTNRTATITAQVTGLSPVQIPIQITGTTISLSTDSTNIAVDESPATLTILVQGADGFGVESLVTLSAEPAGVVTLSQYTDNTDTIGNLEVTITGVAAGSVIVTVQALGATATQNYTVGTSDEVFCITSPSDDTYSLSTNIDLTITVNAPTQEDVRFATSLGTWDEGADLVVTKAVSGGSAEADLTSSKAGTANVQVFDAADALLTDSLTVIFSAPSFEASQITLQASATIMPPSTEDVTNSVTLTATVKNVTDQVVRNAAVAFSIENPTGGGESIFPVVAYTNDHGVATSTFTSGSLSTDNEGVSVKVTVVGTYITDTVNIVIGGTAGSVVIGRSTVIESIDNDTAYKLPMSVLVADSNGNPVASATVSLGAWPLKYSTGYWVVVGVDECVPYITGTYDNEDANRNLIRDEDEDTGSSGDPCDGDGQLTPLSSAAGSLPAIVTTDENGVANFDLVYLKQYAIWIVEEITASTLVLGTETTSILEFTLPYLEDEACNLPHSPYGGGTQSLTITASATGYGWISPSGEVEVNYGDNQIFTITPNAGYVPSVLVDGWPATEDLTQAEDSYYYKFENVTKDHTIQATFVEEEPEEEEFFTITASAGPNGLISPSGEVEVNYGNDQIFVIIPNAGYAPSVLVDGWPATKDLTQAEDSYYYKFENVTKDHTIQATFVEEEEG